MKKVPFLILLCGILLAVVFLSPGMYQAAQYVMYPRPHAALVSREAKEFSLEENLLYAIMKAESGYEEKAQSRAHAKGLMQLTDPTFAWISSLYPPENGGGDIFDPGDNIHCAAALLHVLLREFGSQREALSAYNAGMGNVGKWLEDKTFSDDGKELDHIPFPETRAYVEKVFKYYFHYQALYGKK